MDAEVLMPRRGRRPPSIEPSRGRKPPATADAVGQLKPGKGVYCRFVYFRVLPHSAGGQGPI